jgi:hypothetical protein
MKAEITSESREKASSTASFNEKKCVKNEIPYCARQLDKVFYRPVVNVIVMILTRVRKQRR